MTIKTSSAIASPAGIIGRLSGVITTMFSGPTGPAPAGERGSRSPLTPSLTGPSRIVSGALPDDFQAFTPAEVTEARKLFREIIACRAEVMRLVEPEIRRAYRENPGALGDAALDGRLAQAQVLRSAAKQRSRDAVNRLGEVLSPGLLRAADAVRRTAEELENAERNLATKLGIDHRPGVVVVELRKVEGLLRDSARGGGAGSAPSLAAGTFGLIVE